MIRTGERDSPGSSGIKVCISALEQSSVLTKFIIFRAQRSEVTSR